MKTLVEILDEFKLNQGNTDGWFGTDKAHGHTYIDFYEENFSKYKHKKINLVEIGVRCGASIKLWREYFSNAMIYGIDNGPIGIEMNEEWVSGDNVQYIECDAYTQECVDKLPNKIDILIDDGPHFFESHVKLLQLYLHKINKGGILVIEDVNYDPQNLIRQFPENIRSKVEVPISNGKDNRLIVVKDF